MESVFLLFVAEPPTNPEDCRISLALNSAALMKNALPQRGRRGGRFAGK